MAELVTHVDESGAFRPDPPGQFDRTIEVEMGGVRPLAEEVEHQGGEAVEGGPALRGDGGHVGAPREGKGARLPGERQAVRAGGLDPETQDREAAVEEPERLDPQSVEQDRVPRTELDVEQIGHVGDVHVPVLRVDVGVDAMQCLEDLRLRVDPDRLAHEGVVPPDLVQAEDVVDVGVGDEDGVAAIEPVPQGLLAVIGRDVDQDRPGVAGGIDEPERGPASESSIPRIVRATDRAVASDAGNACGRPGTQEFEPEVTDGGHEPDPGEGSRRSMAATISRLAARGSSAPQIAALTATPLQPSSESRRASGAPIPPMARCGNPG